MQPTIQKETDMTNLTSILDFVNEYVSFGYAAKESVAYYIDNHTVITAHINDVLIGVVTICRDRSQGANTYYLANLATHKDYRYMGIARKIVETAIEHVPPNSLITLHSWRQPTGWEAEKLFNSLGFSLQQETKDHYTPECNSGEYKCPNRTDKCQCTSEKHALLTEV